MKSLQKRFFHTLTKNGEIDRQGEVVSRFGSKVKVQWFSWIDGKPNIQQTLNQSDLEQWRFYESRQAWKAAGDLIWK